MDTAVERKNADVVVLGLGAMGSAALYQLARRGVDVLGIDRFDPPHNHGSSHGGSRVTRESVAEGAAYVPLVQRTHQILAGLEEEFGEALLVRSGTLVIGSPGGSTALHGAEDFLDTTAALAARFGIDHEILDAAQLRIRFPQFLTIRDTDRGYLEPRSGFIRPEATISAQINAARGLGARTLVNTTVTGMSQANGIVTLMTTAGSVQAKRVVVAAGAWARGLLGSPFDRLLTVTRQVLHWFRIDDPPHFAPARMPTFIWFPTDRLEDYFTGFPVLDASDGFKVTASKQAPDIDHESVGPEGTPEESREFYDRHLRGAIRGVTPQLLTSATCFYTNTPDNGFIIDDHPAMNRVLVVSACSGHGFKHSAGIGEAVAERIVEGRSGIDLRPFNLARFRDAPR